MLCCRIFKSRFRELKGNNFTAVLSIHKPYDMLLMTVASLYWALATGQHKTSTTIQDHILLHIILTDIKMTPGIIQHTPPASRTYLCTLVRQFALQMWKRALAKATHIVTYKCGTIFVPYYITF
jgi:hypothetical protein